MRYAVLFALLGLSGCATTQADVKAVAEVCTPQLAGDAVQALPLVIALVTCETTGGDCSSEVTAVEHGAELDAAACALAEVHAATVHAAAAAAAAK